MRMYGYLFMFQGKKFLNINISFLGAQKWIDMKVISGAYAFSDIKELELVEN